MSTRNTLIVSLLLVVIAVVASGFVYARLPEQVASHWNVNDEVDGTMSRFWGAYLMPLISLGMLVLFLIVPSIDPLKANVEKFRAEFNLFIVLIIAFMLYLHGLTIAWNLGYQSFKMSLAMLPAMGFLFVFIGWMMTKAKRNYFIGIRTPWTLSSDLVWDKTHALGGRLFMIAGGVVLFSGFFGVGGILLMVIAILLSAFVPIIYSYVLYQQETKAK
jgi:uncharacterized membrane protein